MGKKRSKGVTIFVCLFLFWGVLGLIGSSVAIWKISSPKTALYMVFVIAMSMLHLFIGFHLLKLKEWARKGAIYISIIDMIGVLVVLLSRGVGNVRLRVWEGLIISAIAIYFFTRPKVKEQFKYELPSKKSDNTV